MAAHPTAKVVGAPTGSGASMDAKAFAALTAEHPDAIVINPPDDAAAADAAFARLCAANPTAAVFDAGSDAGPFPAMFQPADEQEAADAEAAFQALCAQSPGAAEIAPGVFALNSI